MGRSSRRSGAKSGMDKSHPTRNRDRANNKEALTQLGQFIRSERKRNSLTQTELANLSGTSLNFVSQLEIGKETAHISKVLDVLDAIGLQFSVELGKKRIDIKVSQK
jgi:HTH-type transcriptional regulator/antitoxin HipB